MGTFPLGIMEKADFLLHCFANPWILSGFVAAFFASLTWMAAMTHFELSFAYPFTILSFVAIQAFSILFFGEMLTISKIAGTLLIAAGIFALTR
jgi:drug/metabolite transporter (DMT)-like permease